MLPTEEKKAPPSPSELPAKSPEKVYNLYSSFKGLHFSMPGGWNDKSIGIFVQCCRMYLDDLKKTSNDDYTRWRRIALFGARISKNNNLFTINSCMEVAQCIRSYIVVNLERMANNEVFQNFYSDVKDLLEYFPLEPNIRREHFAATSERIPASSNSKPGPYEQQPCKDEAQMSRSMKKSEINASVEEAPSISGNTPSKSSPLKAKPSEVNPGSTSVSTIQKKEKVMKDRSSPEEKKKGQTLKREKILDTERGSSTKSKNPKCIDTPSENLTVDKPTAPARINAETKIKDQTKNVTQVKVLTSKKNESNGKIVSEVKEAEPSVVSSTSKEKIKKKKTKAISENQKTKLLNVGESSDGSSTCKSGNSSESSPAKNVLRSSNKESKEVLNPSSAKSTKEQMLGLDTSQPDSSQSKKTFEEAISGVTVIPSIKKSYMAASATNESKSPRKKKPVPVLSTTYTNIIPDDKLSPKTSNLNNTHEPCIKKSRTSPSKKNVKTSELKKSVTSTSLSSTKEASNINKTAATLSDPKPPVIISDKCMVVPNLSNNETSSSNISVVSTTLSDTESSLISKECAASDIDATANLMKCEENTSLSVSKSLSSIKVISNLPETSLSPDVVDSVANSCSSEKKPSPDIDNSVASTIACAPKKTSSMDKSAGNESSSIKKESSKKQVSSTSSIVPETLPSVKETTSNTPSLVAETGPSKIESASKANSCSSKIVSGLKKSKRKLNKAKNNLSNNDQGNTNLASTTSSLVSETGPSKMKSAAEANSCSSKIVSGLKKSGSKSNKKKNNSSNNDQGNSILNSSIFDQGNSILNLSNNDQGNSILNSSNNDQGNSTLNSSNKDQGNSILNSSNNDHGNSILNSSNNDQGNSILNSSNNDQGNSILNSSYNDHGNSILNSSNNDHGNSILNSSNNDQGNSILDPSSCNPQTVSSDSLGVNLPSEKSPSEKSLVEPSLCESSDLKNPVASASVPLSSMVSLDEPKSSSEVGYVASHSSKEVNIANSSPCETEAPQVVITLNDKSELLAGKDRLLSTENEIKQSTNEIKDVKTSVDNDSLHQNDSQIDNKENAPINNDSVASAEVLASILGEICSMNTIQLNESFPPDSSPRKTHSEEVNGEVNPCKDNDDPSHDLEKDADDKKRPFKKRVRPSFAPSVANAESDKESTPILKNEDTTVNKAKLIDENPDLSSKKSNTTDDKSKSKLEKNDVESKGRISSGPLYNFPNVQKRKRRRPVRIRSSEDPETPEASGVKDGTCFPHNENNVDKNRPFKKRGRVGFEDDTGAGSPQFKSGDTVLAEYFSKDDKSELCIPNVVKNVGEAESSSTLSNIQESNTLLEVSTSVPVTKNSGSDVALDIKVENKNLEPDTDPIDCKATPSKIIRKRVRKPKTTDPNSVNQAVEAAKDKVTEDKENKPLKRRGMHQKVLTLINSEKLESTPSENEEESLGTRRPDEPQKKRGRPSKVQNTFNNENLELIQPESTEELQETKKTEELPKQRERTPSVQLESAEESQETKKTYELPQKRRRPPRVQTLLNNEKENLSQIGAEEESQKPYELPRKRGRPPKPTQCELDKESPERKETYEHPKKMGGPPKVENLLNNGEESGTQIEPEDESKAIKKPYELPRKRGRPRVHALQNNKKGHVIHLENLTQIEDKDGSQESKKLKKKRGRPPKIHKKESDIVNGEYNKRDSTSSTSTLLENGYSKFSFRMNPVVKLIDFRIYPEILVQEAKTVRERKILTKILNEANSTKSLVVNKDPHMTKKNKSKGSGLRAHSGSRERTRDAQPTRKLNEALRNTLNCAIELYKEKNSMGSSMNHEIMNADLARGVVDNAPPQANNLTLMPTGHPPWAQPYLNCPEANQLLQSAHFINKCQKITELVTNSHFDYYHPPEKYSLDTPFWFSRFHSDVIDWETGMYQSWRRKLKEKLMEEHKLMDEIEQSLKDF